MKEEEDMPEMSPSEEVMNWREKLRSFKAVSREPLEILSMVWSVLDKVPSPLGMYVYQLQGNEVPVEDAVQPDRGADLLPLHPDVMDRFPMLLPHERQATKLAIAILNFLSMGGRNNGKNLPSVPRSLSSGQEHMIFHLMDRIKDLGSEERSCHPLSEETKHLKSVRYDYGGEPIHPMEDLVASKVISVWPQVGQCAVQPVVDYLPQAMIDMLQDPASCLLPRDEWPDRPTISRVRASRSEWDLIVSAGYERGMMVGIPPEKVFRDHNGYMVLNGAGAVRKTKVIDGQEVVLQRFISNLIPSNQYQKHILGGDKYLPYLGQLTLLEQGEDQTFLIDSESCFNLFTLPEAWWPLMCFAQPVDASLLGGPRGELIYPAMRVVPMGWISAVSVIQSVVRTLVFEGAEIPESSEVTKIKEIPDTDDLTVIYLDSYDELRRLDSKCAEVLRGQPSERHRRFKSLCEEKGLPLNAAKSLVEGSLQGGTLDGAGGWYKLSNDKQVNLVGLGAALLAAEKWSEHEVRHFLGKATFGLCFRRPLFSILQDIFPDLQRMIDQGPKEPAKSSIDEVIMIMGMVAFMGTHLKVGLDPEISCSDASPTGGGGAVAIDFMPEPATVSHDGDECWMCDHRFEGEERFPCPSQCGAIMCCIGCVWNHRDCSSRDLRGCPRKRWKVPRFGERFSGPNAPLTRAIAETGCMEVQKPFDLLLGDDFFSDDGRNRLARDMDDPLLYLEHWAPECKLFSRARGRPIRLPGGRVIQGPQPVRDEKHVMGFPWLQGEMKARLRQSNAMALKAIKRGKSVARERQPRHFTVEHPRNSWVWDFTLIKELETQGFAHAIGSCCCFGGQREKWFSFFGTADEIWNEFNRACPGHANLLDYTVTVRDDGSLHYPTEEEAEYPTQLCRCYARGAKAQLEKEGVFQAVKLEEREGWYQQQLGESTGRLSIPEVSAPVAAYLAKWELSMTRSSEVDHLRELLRSASMRGTDVRFFMQLGTEEEQHEVPYPALRWRWRTVTSYRWRHEGHINELEMNALVVMSRHRGRNVAKLGKRWMHVLDSMVSRGALAKGRSSSVRINRPLRKHAAHSIAQDNYLFPLWTISGWNFSDKASRQ